MSRSFFCYSEPIVQHSIGSDFNIESLQDTATYDSKQKNMGFNTDIDIAGGGAGSSISVNGGKTDLNADYKGVGEQSGIFTGDGGFDLTAGGKTTLIGGAITTTEAARDAGRNRYTSADGITTKDLKNSTSYDGDAIQVGVSIGQTNNKPQASMNGLGYGSDSDSDSSVTIVGITGIAGNKDITTDNRAEYAGALENVFDETRVNEELGAQVEITQAFDQERRKVKTEINTKEKKLRDEAEEQGQLGNTTARDKLIEQADKVQNKGLLFDAISGAIYGPNSNGATGYAAKAASPFVSNQIGQYYKEQSETQGDSLTGSQQAGHILAHSILGAAVSYATGNNAVTGGISAGAGEATAPVLSKFLYGSSDPANLTAEQKDTISAITSAVGLTIGTTTGNANDAANAAETSKVAVDNNHSADLRVDKQLGRVGKSPFSDKEARFIAASIGIAVWPVGVLDAYLKADSDADKILIIREAFGGIKARAISEALQEARGVKSSKNDANGMEPDNDLYSNKPSGKQEYYPLGTTNVKIASEKFDYFFGLVKGDPHNTARSLQNKQQLANIGIHNNRQGRKIITDTINEGVSNSSNVVSKYTKVGREGVIYNLEDRTMLLKGPGGFKQLNASFEVYPDNTRKLTTIILKGGGK